MLHLIIGWNQYPIFSTSPHYFATFGGLNFKNSIETLSYINKNIYFLCCSKSPKQLVTSMDWMGEFEFDDMNNHVQILILIL